MIDSLSPLLDSLGWALLHSLWQIAAISALAWLALRVVPAQRPAVRFMIAYGGMAASFIAFAVTFFIYSRGGPADGATVASLVSTAPQSGLAEMLGGMTWAVSLLWSLGFAALGLRYARALRATWRLRHDRVTGVPEFWERCFALWAERVGVGRVAIGQSPFVSSPVTIGALRPIVLVPIGFFLRLPRDQAEAILLHELAHIRRQDYLLGLVQEAIKAVFFFHPCIYWLSRRIDAEREYACDEIVLAETGDARALARGLGRIAIDVRSREPGFAMAATGGTVSVLDRIRRLAGAPACRDQGSAGLAAAISLMMLAASCLIAFGADASARLGGGGTDDLAADRFAGGTSVIGDHHPDWSTDESWTIEHDEHAAVGHGARADDGDRSPARVAALGDILNIDQARMPDAWEAFARNVASDVTVAVRHSMGEFRLASAPQTVPFAPNAPAAPSAPEAAAIASAIAVRFEQDDGRWDAFAERMTALAEARAEAAACEAEAEAESRADATVEIAERRREAAERVAEAQAERIARQAEAAAERYAAHAERAAGQAEAAAERYAALAESRAERVAALASARSARIGALAGQLGERRARAAHAAQAVAEEIEREADELERELDREAEELEREIERTLNGMT